MLCELYRETKEKVIPSIKGIKDVIEENKRKKGINIVRKVLSFTS